MPKDSEQIVKLPFSGERNRAGFVQLVEGIIRDRWIHGRSFRCGQAVAWRELEPLVRNPILYEYCGARKQTRPWRREDTQEAHILWRWGGEAWEIVAEFEGPPGSHLQALLPILQRELGSLPPRDLAARRRHVLDTLDEELDRTPACDREDLIEALYYAVMARRMERKPVTSELATIATQFGTGQR
jgi:hypothetical protein